jgi:hypothetical protein
MSPVSSMTSSMLSSTPPMLSDPFIYKLSQMCSKDAVVQSLYTGRVSWADIPSDDDVLELDDWESYNKIHTYAKTSYQRVYNARQRREQLRFTNKKQNNHTRTPYLTLKQNRFEPLRCDSPVSSAEVIETPVKAPIIEHSAETSVVELPVSESAAELPVVESLIKIPLVEVPLDEILLKESIEELPIEELPIEESLIEIPLDESVQSLVESFETPKKTMHIKKMSVYERKCKEKEKYIAKKIHVAPVILRKKRFSLHNFFINLLIISFIISMMMSGILVFM